ncbi:hypothetical protein E2C01_088340 [Portunus trituberculatus]|uniref:Uncharacterized protein n=1 Tax=Portunus trituberculatus TaxID=210409 RepID=A0A5B7JJ41_PORTR|nr:hypothetical protein [Portunus trituberculatus]
MSLPLSVAVNLSGRPTLATVEEEATRNKMDGKRCTDELEARLTKARKDNKGKDMKKRRNYETKHRRMKRGTKDGEERTEAHESKETAGDKERSKKLKTG